MIPIQFIEVAPQCDLAEIKVNIKTTVQQGEIDGECNSLLLCYHWFFASFG